RLSDMRGEAECTALLSRIMLRPIAYFNRLYVDYRGFDSAFFAGEIDGETYNANRADLNNICGMDVQVEFIGDKAQPRVGRTYFGHGAAVHVTGYVGTIPIDGVLNVDYWRDRGYSDSDLVGQDGIEFAYQDTLAGQPEQSLRLIDSSGVILRELGTATGTGNAPVTLTLDRGLQYATAQAFIDAWNYANPNWATVATGGAAVVMDVNTGAVRAMFSYPTYDPLIFLPSSTYYSTNTAYAGAISQIGRATTVGFAATTNRAYSQQYAPGSVFKILTALAAADTGTWGRDQIFNCELTWDGSSLGDTGGTRQDWRLVSERDPAGEITMSTALTTSCNPFFWEVGALMFNESPGTFNNYATSWGFGTQLDPIGYASLIPSEASGSMPFPEDVTTAVNNAIGQGNTQVTALQMARLVAAVANGGTLYRPLLVEQVGGRDGTEILETIEPIVDGQLGVSDMALAVVQEGMCNVPIDPDFGTSTSSFAENDTPPSYTSCGKTGTAEAGTAPNSWYVAYAPADNPQIAIAVVVPNSREGSEVATPITRRILDYYFSGAVAEYPEWWQDDYEPVPLPELGGA
ncbi:MAG: penicillin-binding transpeptidase domain-containing protein, partial [Chloroflexota bacterium]